MLCSVQVTDSYLVTYVQSKDDGQHAGGRVATVALGPVIINILKENRVHHQNLNTRTHTQCYFVNRINVSGFTGSPAVFCNEVFILTAGAYRSKNK